MPALEIGIDLGTRNVLVYTSQRGIVLKEPSLVAYDKDSDKIIAYGEEARQILGKNNAGLMAIRPIRRGAIADYPATEKMMKYFIAKAIGRRAFRKPRISICIPGNTTEVERLAVEEAAYQAGAREVFLVNSPLAAAIGMGIDVLRPSGNMIVDIGAGSTDLAILSMGDVVVSRSIKVGGDNFNEMIMRHIRREYQLFIGEDTAETIKIRIGTVWEDGGIAPMEIKGRNCITGLPGLVTLEAEEIRRAMQEPMTQILDAIRSILEQTPPELAADIVDRGIILTGGGASLNGLEDLVEAKTGVNTLVSQDPTLSVVVGTGKYARIFGR